MDPQDGPQPPSHDPQAGLGYLLGDDVQPSRGSPSPHQHVWRRALRHRPLLGYEHWGCPIHREAYRSPVSPRHERQYPARRRRWATSPPSPVWAVIIDASPLFSYILELQALHMTAGIPESRLLYRPSGELAVIQNHVLSRSAAKAARSATRVPPHTQPPQHTPCPRRPLRPLGTDVPRECRAKRCERGYG